MTRRPLNPRTLALTAIMTAIVLVLTSLIKVPTPARGYAHLGDAGVFFSAFALGPWVGAVAGGLGTALADILGGYPQWAVFSLVIHGLQGWVAGWLVRRDAGLARLILAAVVGGVIVVAGYFLAGIILVGIGDALAEIVPNILQVSIGAALAIPLFAAVRQAYPPITRLGK
jgi:uncharacterized membrane protein